MAKDWYNEGRRRDDVRATAPEVGKHRSRKNTRRWCRGKKGVEHQPELRINKYSLSLNRGEPCHRMRWNAAYWWCNHERYCVNCGKILAHTLDRDCPDYQPLETTKEDK